MLEFDFCCCYWSSAEIVFLDLDNLGLLLVPVQS